MITVCGYSGSDCAASSDVVVVAVVVMLVEVEVVSR